MLPRNRERPADELRALVVFRRSAIIEKEKAVLDDLAQLAD
jgi:hypothetical protein